MKQNELTYWVTLASMPKIWTKRKNELYVNCYLHTPKYSIVDLFESQEIWNEIGMTIEEQMLFLEAKKQLANNSFLVEDLLSQGYDILPLTSPLYSKTLKVNLKQSAPTVLYVKGNKDLINSPSVGIVGSRKAEEISLDFTSNVAKKAVGEGKVVVSGFAKGIDRQALDIALSNNGKSIIVLPQGIMTFSSGFREYYRPTVEGRLLTISTFHPKAPWCKELAMARNTIIYGLSDEIYTAQSDSKGGTWSGVLDGLRRGRTIYVRKPSSEEKNANMTLIEKGAIPVDIFGNPLPKAPQKTANNDDITPSLFDNV